MYLKLKKKSENEKWSWDKVVKILNDEGPCVLNPNAWRKVSMYLYDNE